MVTNMSVFLLSAADILPVSVSVVPLEKYNFEGETNVSATYSNADISLFGFGDFIRGMIMICKLFATAPTTLCTLLAVAGMPILIVTILKYCLWTVYMVGVAQFIAKYSLEGNV